MSSAGYSRHRARAGFFFVLTGIAALVPFFVGPAPFRGLASFPVAEEVFDSARIVDLTGGRSSSHELQIHTGSGHTYTYRNPRPERPAHYLIWLPARGQPVQIRFFTDWGARKLLEVRAGGKVYIPGEEIMAEERFRLRFIWSFAVIFATIGLVNHSLERSRRASSRGRLSRNT